LFTITSDIGNNNSNGQEENIPAPVSVPDARDEPNTEQSTEQNTYGNLELGVLQNVLYLLSKSAKASILLAVWFGIVMNTSDTGSDVWIFTILMSRQLVGLAWISLGTDFLPGIMVTLHHITSSGWSQISRTQKIVSVGLLTIQPFSLIVTNLTWMADIGNEHWHYMSRLSTIIHGAIESPIQLIFLVYLWSKGFIRPPWEESSILKDRNGNSVALGNIAGTFSLTLSVIGIIKGALDVFESHDSKFKFFVFTAINITYRVCSYAYFIQYFDSWFYIAPLVVLILVPNSCMFLRLHGSTGYQGKRIGLVSSILCSFVVPVTTTEKPHNFQKKITSLNANEQQKETENRKKTSDEMRRNSAILSWITSPVILLADACVWLVSRTGTFQHDSVWTNLQLEQFFLHFLMPTFFVAILSAYSLHRNCEKTTEVQQNSSMPTKFIKKVQNIPGMIKTHVEENLLAVISVIAMILITSMHCSTMQTTNAYLVGFEEQDQIRLFEARTSFDLPSSQDCDDNGSIVVCNLNASIFTNDDYRKVSALKENRIYLNDDVNVTMFPEQRLYNIITNELDWDKISTKNHLCKKCISPSSVRCKMLILDGYQVEDCQGTNSNY
jgi:hypothetical protein